MIDASGTIGTATASAAALLAAAGWGVSARRFARFAKRIRALSEGSASGRGVEEDVAALEALVATLRGRIANTHPVSGLPTRERLLAEIEAAPQGEALLGVIWFSDYDRLAAFDIDLAERVLVTLVERLGRMLRASRLLCQVDRSHIALWYPPGDDPDAAEAELAALAYALGDAVRDGEQEIDPEIRFGSARSGRAAPAARELLARAIASLSSPTPLDRRSGGISTLDDAESVARDRYRMEQDLRRAVSRGEFELGFQPLIDAQEQRVCGAEALIRWNHPELGLVPPSRFVPIAEAAGLADAVGQWTLNAACRAAAQWRGQGLGGLRIAVNVSGHQIEAGDLPLLVARALERHAVPASMLEIELTESVATASPDEAAALLGRLRASGVRIAIDDFGTGFSSMSTLRTLPFDKIKIDREFVTAVDTRRDSQAICASMIALAQGLGINVLAEGVERAAEYLWLMRHGCRLFQGFYFSRPLDGDAFVAFTRDRAATAALCRPALLHSETLHHERLRA